MHTCSCHIPSLPCTRADKPLLPNKSNGTAGACSYGPVIYLVAVKLRPDTVRQCS